MFVEIKKRATRDGAAQLRRALHHGTRVFLAVRVLDPEFWEDARQLRDLAVLSWPQEAHTLPSVVDRLLAGD